MRKPPRRSRRGRADPPAEHHDERWLVSYSDMVTVLFALFLVLFAMSSVDNEKYELMAISLAEGFGNTDIPENTANIAPPAATPEAQPPTPLERALLEKSKFEKLKKRIDAELAASGQQGAVDYNIDQRGLTVRLVSSETFFKPNSAELSASAVSITRSISRVLAPTDYPVAVEGYADVRRPLHPYPTNWELSSGRATAVVRAMVERGGMDAVRMSSTGFGDARPSSAGNLAADRRVDVVVLSREPETVRSLIPKTSTESKPSGG